MRFGRSKPTKDKTVENRIKFVKEFDKVFPGGIGHDTAVDPAHVMMCMVWDDEMLKSLKGILEHNDGEPHLPSYLVTEHSKHVSMYSMFYIEKIIALAKASGAEWINIHAEDNAPISFTTEKFMVMVAPRVDGTVELSANILGGIKKVNALREIRKQGESPSGNSTSQP